jgi:hypothetical protein
MEHAMNRASKSGSICLLLLLNSSTAVACPEHADVKSKLEVAISVAIHEARKCSNEIDESEMTVTIVDSTYRISLSMIGNVRGGAAEVLVDRASGEVRGVTCFQ